MSVKQDGTRVRTAHDLERKYKLAEMQKAFEQNENTITKVDQILRDFVNVIIGTLENYEGLADGHVMTYFYRGVPTMETLPTTEWTDSPDNHLNDVYYDKDSGKVHTFTKIDDEYTWLEEENKEKVKVMAMANATTDTKDSKRRIFTTTPTTPYENGDLWVKDGVIYCCQISKPGTEVFEEFDFIESSLYSGDTNSIKIGTELEVLKGTVLKIIEDSDFMKVQIDDLDKETASSIELIKNMLSVLITDEKGQSMMTQTSDGWKFEMKSIIEVLNNNSTNIEGISKELEGTSADIDNINGAVKELLEKTTYVNVGTWEGKPCVELGAKDSKYKAIFTNEELVFAEGSDTPASIKDGTMTMDKANVKDEIQIYNMAWVRRANKHLSLLPKGVIE